MHKTFVLHDVSSQNAILLCWFVPRDLQMVRTFLNDFQVSNWTRSYLPHTHALFTFIVQLLGLF